MKKALLCSLSLIIISALFLTACDGNHQPSPENLLLNPGAEEGEEHWTGSGEAAIDDSFGATASFSLRNGGSYYQDVTLGGQAGRYALLIGCLAAENVHPDGSITDLPYLYGYMMRDQTRIDVYLQGQRLHGEGMSAGAWSTAWGVFEIPETTSFVRVFLNQALMSGVPYSGAAAYFDSLGLYLFDTENAALNYVDRYQQGCGDAASIQVIHQPALTILSNGSQVGADRVGTKRITIQLQVGADRRVDNPPYVLYWSDFVSGDGFEPSTPVPGEELTYYFDLPTSAELDLCQWMKYRWVVGYQNTLLNKSGILVDEEGYVMPSKKYVGNTVQQASCQSPD